MGAHRYRRTDFTIDRSPTSNLWSRCPANPRLVSRLARRQTTMDPTDSDDTSDDVDCAELVELFGRGNLAKRIAKPDFETVRKQDQLRQSAIVNPSATPRLT